MAQLQAMPGSTGTRGGLGMPVSAGLASLAMNYARRGWAVTASNGHSMVVAKTEQRGKPVNHVFHLLMTVLSFGLWLPIWGLCIVFGGERTYEMRILVEQTEDGKIRNTPL